MAGLSPVDAVDASKIAKNTGLLESSDQSVAESMTVDPSGIPKNNVEDSAVSESVVTQQESGNMPTPVLSQSVPFKMPLFGPRLGVKRKSGGAVTKTFLSPVSENKDPKAGENIGSKSSDIVKMSGDHLSNLESNTHSGVGDTKDSSAIPREEKHLQTTTVQQNIPYKIPIWSGTTSRSFSIEVLKNGVIVDTLDMTTKPFYVFGRIPSCDIYMEHPSVSRQHAILQFCAVPNENHEEGWYLYDLDSTHGTWINKNKVKPRVYYRVRVGHVIKFGGSSRLYIFQGPEEDQEEESELTVTELKEQRERQLREAEVLAAAEQLAWEEKQKQIESSEDTGCSWGMGEDAVEAEVENSIIIAEAIPQNEELYIEDPKKALRGYFEREGYDLPEYDIEEAGRGKHKCRVELPIDGPSGEPIIAEVTASGKKKEAVAACALEACRILDRHGVLRKSHHESRKKKKRNWEDDDYYDSDEDTFLDRTGAIEKKRQMRMKKAGKLEKKAETYESLLEKLEEVEKEMKDIEDQLAKSKKEAEEMEAEEVDALDAYMSSIKSGAMDSKTRMKLKRQLFDLKQEEQKLRKLVNVAKPAKLPELMKAAGGSTQTSRPLTGKMHKSSKPVWNVTVGTATTTKITDSAEVEVEEEEDEEEEDDKEETKIRKNTAASKLRDNIQRAVSFGPTLPPGVVSLSHSETTKTTKPQENMENMETSSNTVEMEPVKKAKKKSPDDSKLQKFKKPMKPGAEPKDYDPADPDYAVWLPPQGQTGDGRTHLNAKFGY